MKNTKKMVTAALLAAYAIELPKPVTPAIDDY